MLLLIFQLAYWFILYSNYFQVLQGRKASLVKLSKLPGAGSIGIDDNHLSCVNKLRENWHKGLNAIVIDDHVSLIQLPSHFSSNVFDESVHGSRIFS